MKLFVTKWVNELCLCKSSWCGAFTLLLCHIQAQRIQLISNHLSHRPEQMPWGKMFIMNLYSHPFVCACRDDMPGEELVSCRGVVVGSQVQPNDVAGRGLLWRRLWSLSPHIWGNVSWRRCDEGKLIKHSMICCTPMTPITGVTGKETGYTLGSSPVFRRVIQRGGQRLILWFTPKANVELPVNLTCMSSKILSYKYVYLMKMKCLRVCLKI